ncbi:MAG: hypothetical protein MH204_03460, partial [Fimbriimonadaceae bacterium]|nr:hypothetical protein [Fimbriimonadaceae bacterium]
PFSADPLSISVRVHENRVTGVPMERGVLNVDTTASRDDGFAWQATDPVVVSTPNGHHAVFLLGPTATLNNTPTAEQAAGTANRRRFLIARVSGRALPAIFTPGRNEALSPTVEFGRWYPSTLFRNIPVLDAASVANLALPTPPGWTVNNITAEFGRPAFSADPFLTPAQALTSHATQNPTNVLRMAIPIRAEARSDSGETRWVYGVYLSSVVLTTGSPITMGVTQSPLVLLPVGDLFAPITEAALVSHGTGSQRVIVAREGSGGSRLEVFPLPQTAAARAAGPLVLADGAFENMGSPSVIGRSAANGTQVSMEVGFTAKRRGRAHHEAFLGRLLADQSSFGFANDRTRQGDFGVRFDAVSRDPSGSIYWAPGAAWRTASADLDSAGLNRIDLFMTTPAGTVSILEGEGAFDSQSRLLTYNSTVGGQVTFDTARGSIRLSNPALPRGASLTVRYRPRYLAVGSAAAANYRGISMVFDTRGDAFWSTTTGSLVNGDQSQSRFYWFNAFGAQLPVTTAAPGQARLDRFVLSLDRTSGDGAQSTRPYLASLRFGVQLPGAVATVQNPTAATFGRVTTSQLSINWTSGLSGAIPAADQVPAAARFYQVDPFTGRIYFQSEAEGKVVSVTFTPVTEDGTILPAQRVDLTVGLLLENPESAVPLASPGNDGRRSLSLVRWATNASSRVTPPWTEGGYGFTWQSTRTGQSQVYFQVLWPKWYPIPPVPDSR